LDLIKADTMRNGLTSRFTDTKGKEQHVSFPAATVDEDTFVKRQDV
jgi:glutamine synthetase